MTTWKWMLFLVMFLSGPAFAKAPEYVRGDELMLRAFKADDEKLEASIERQYRNQGEEGLSDPKFRRRVRARLEMRETAASDCSDCRRATGSQANQLTSALVQLVAALISSSTGGISVGMNMNNGSLGDFGGINGYGNPGGMGIGTQGDNYGFGQLGSANGFNMGQMNRMYTWNRSYSYPSYPNYQNYQSGYSYPNYSGYQAPNYQYPSYQIPNYSFSQAPYLTSPSTGYSASPVRGPAILPSR